MTAIEYRVRPTVPRRSLFPQVSDVLESANVAAILGESNCEGRGPTAMTTKASASYLPRPDIACLQPLSLGDLALAFIVSQKASPNGALIAKALADLGDGDRALAEALSQGLVCERDGHFAASQESERLMGHAPWPEVKRALAFRALGAAGRANGSDERGDLVAIALRQLYALENLPAAPSRQQVRCELLARILTCLTEPSSLALARPAKAYKFDALSRHLYLAFAGIKSGGVLQADCALLSSAFGGPAATVAELSATIVRAALGRKAPEAPKREEVFDLDGFAESVRGLARKLETKPYFGRVAIAQVYDAALDVGLDLGTLEDFKTHLAAAARDGLLDLERYDITGPLDTTLKERSRLRLGRDERHFIVNQWI
jgi:hypothetical protein